MPDSLLTTPEQRASYKEDGVVCLREAFDPHWLTVASDAIDQGRASPGPMFVDYSADTKPGTYCTDFWIWQQVPAMRDFIFDSPAARIAGELMDVASVMLVTDNWLVRKAGAVNRAPWHHDAPYFDLDGTWCVLWMALEPVARGEGVTFLKGSHTWNRLFMPESFAGTGPKADPRGIYERTPDFSRLSEHGDRVDYALQPGDCLVFDSHMVHGTPDATPPQRTTRRFTMRFAEGDAIYRRRGSWTRDMTDFLEAEYGLIEGGPYRCDLLPILWERHHD